MNPLKRKFRLAGRPAGTHRVTKMKQIHRRIAEDIALGGKDVDIAKSRGVTPQMVRYTRHSPLVKDYIDLVEEKVQNESLYVAKELQELSPFAVRTLEQIMLDPKTNERVRADVAKDLLDRAGHGAVRKVAIAHGELTRDGLADIKAKAKKAAIAAGVVIPNSDDGADIEDAHIIE